MEHQLSAKIMITLTATQEEWDYITEACRTHYDSAVKMAVNAEAGGFMIGFNKQRKWDEPLLSWCFTNREAQTLFKAISSLPGGTAIKLRTDLNAAICHAIAKSEEINKQLQS